MIKRNPHMGALPANYLFQEVRRKARLFLEKEPGASLISLGIGDWTASIPQPIVQGLAEAVQDLGIQEKYTGYGPEQGIESLRALIASKMYPKHIEAEDVFISDGAKCDIARLQVLFGGSVSIAVQDPAYPVYVDGSLIKGVGRIIRMPCTPENNFFPELVRADILYFCSPNNPTGSVLTRDHMEQLVAFARKEGSLIIFDAAYRSYIRDDALPKSIYEISGAEEVAIETNSFSKSAGFTGVRLGWTVVPRTLKYADGASVHQDWKRLIATLFNGASIIAQKGGIVALQQEGHLSTTTWIDRYLDNARLIKQTWEQLGYPVYGGEHAPYVWIQFPGRSSWDVFQTLLEKAHVITTPGSGFGPSGEGFLRMSAYGVPENIHSAVERIQRAFS